MRFAWFHGSFCANQSRPLRLGTLLDPSADADGTDLYLTEPAKPHEASKHLESGSSPTLNILKDRESARAVFALGHRVPVRLVRLVHVPDAVPDHLGHPALALAPYLFSSLAILPVGPASTCS